jgi:LCP family protein required for cell wall assembly
MHKQRPQNYSIDGFTPRPTSARPIGFDMTRARSLPKLGSQPAPKPSLKPIKQPDSFPSVGMTLSSYTPSTPVAETGIGGGAAAFDEPFDQAPPMGRKERKKFKRGSAAGSDTPKKQRRWLRFTKKRLLLLLALLILLPVAWFGYKIVHNFSKVFNGNVLSVLSTTKLKGEDQGRVNILLAGNSADDVGHEGGQLTDSIMIISIDTKDNTAFLLSVPRDLWVNIPDYGHAKINEAYVDGEDEKFSQSGYFPGGMGLLQQVIQENFGITLNYYGLVNYNAFRDMVNAVGGINFTVKSTDKRGLYDPSVDYVTHGPLVKLTNGVHALNGEQALDLARARGDAYGSYGFPGSDFDRTAHQREELLALRAKATSTGVLANPVKVSSLLDAIGNNIKTNFTLGEVRRLYSITKPISSANIQSVSLNSVDGVNLLTNYSSPAGQSALTPAAGLDDFTDIQTLVTRLTSSNPVVREGASVEVLNATDTSGLATKNMTTLTGKGLTSAGVADAATNQAKTTIIDLSTTPHPATKALLMKQYGVTSVTTTDPYKGAYNADFIVVIGADQVPKTTTTTTTPATGN